MWRSNKLQQFRGQLNLLSNERVSKCSLTKKYDIERMSFSPPAPPKITRRDATKLLGGAIVTGLIAPPLIAQQAATAPPTYSRLLSEEDLAFLEEMERAGCLYFSEQADPATGQVLDRATNKTSTGELDAHFASSIAATGFGLTALCISDKRGYIPTARIKKQIITTLDFHLNKMPNEHGFFYHFSDVKTGKPLINVEVSSIDTAIFLCGVLTARAYFNDPKITDLATQLYNRVDCPWMLNGGKTFSMGWRPRDRLHPTRWDHYSELMMLYLLAIGSPTHPVSAESWNAFTRPPMTFGPYSYISATRSSLRPPVLPRLVRFRRQTRCLHELLCQLHHCHSRTQSLLSRSQAWLHRRLLGRLRLRLAARLHRLGRPSPHGPGRRLRRTLCRGGFPPIPPRDCVRVLRALRDNFGDDAWGRYGFCDAFHPDLHWYDPDVLGIDLGISVLMAENLRSAFVWDTFMQNPEPVAAMKACGFHSSRQVNPPAENIAPVPSPNQPVAPSTNRPSKP